MNEYGDMIHNLEADRGVHTFTLGMNEYGDMIHNIEADRGVHTFTLGMNEYGDMIHNLEADRGVHTFTLGMNEYGDMIHNLEADRGVHTFTLGMNEYGDMTHNLEADRGVHTLTLGMNEYGDMTHNLEADRGVHTLTLGMNEYGDMTSKEFSKVMNGYRMRNITEVKTEFHQSLVDISDLPDTVDWREKGYVTEVKNQKQCGSCWAFSTTGSLEGQHFKSTGKLVSLSEQNLEITGVKENGKCRFKQENVGATDSGYKDVSIFIHSEEALQKAVAEVGPISVAIDASLSSFQLYKSGVYSDILCSTSRLDHGVLAVGYGTYDSKPYWLVKN
ncbi:hypothetical protein KUTeg_011025, partial [Tegillarca granosa]